MADNTVGQLKNFAVAGKKIAGIGLNYYSLIKVLKVNKPTDPVIFLKPSTSYITEGKPIVIPKGFAINGAIELGVIIGKKGKHIDVKNAMDHVGGYCAALDVTSTSEIEVAKSAGLPWCLSKGFDTACPVSRFISKDEIPDPHNLDLWCKINGVMKQEGNTNDMIFNVPQLVSYISKYMTLEENDLILAGSPPGMGNVVPGDVIESGIKNLVSMKFTVVAE